MFDDDLDIIGQEFMESVTVTLSGVAVTTLDGIFNEEGASVALYDSEIATSLPSVLCRSTDIQAIADDYNSYLLVIRGGKYQFNGPPQPLADGYSLIVLTKD